MAFLHGLLISLLPVAYLFLIAPRQGKMCMQDMPRYFAHRGMHDAKNAVPENSLAAFRRAIGKGYGIELDVHLAKDGSVIVHHDDSLLRLCGVDRKISETGLDVLAGYCLGETDEKIPTLSQVLKVVHGQVPLLIELKTDRCGDNRLAARVHEEMQGYLGVWLVQSFDPLQLRWFKKHAPHVLRGQLAFDQGKLPGKKPSFSERMAGHLLFNFLSRPDFISYGYETDKNFSFRVMRAVFHPVLAAWTVRSKKDSEALHETYDAQIFEAFHP